VHKGRDSNKEARVLGKGSLWTLEDGLMYLLLLASLLYIFLDVNMDLMIK
jgi:hypothetical protein